MREPSFLESLVPFLLLLAIFVGFLAGCLCGGAGVWLSRHFVKSSPVRTGSRNSLTGGGVLGAHSN